MTQTTNKFPVEYDNVAASPPGPTTSWLVASAGTGSIDVSTYKGRFVRVQVIGGTDADIWFDDTSTSANNVDTSLVFENGIGEKLYPSQPSTSYVIPGFKTAQTCFLHFVATGTPDLRITIG